MPEDKDMEMRTFEGKQVSMDSGNKVMVAQEAESGAVVIGFERKRNEHEKDGEFGGLVTEVKDERQVIKVLLTLKSAIALTRLLSEITNSVVSYRCQVENLLDSDKE